MFDNYDPYRELACAHCTVSNDDMGSHYINYGRQDCPSGDSLVYAGRVIGAWYTHTGSATNNLCVEPTPDYLDYNSAASSSKALI